MKNISIETAEREQCERLMNFFVTEYGQLSDEGKAVFVIMLRRSLGSEMKRIIELMSSGKLSGLEP